MKGQYDNADWSGLVSAIQVDVCSEMEELRASGYRLTVESD